MNQKALPLLLLSCMMWVFFGACKDEQKDAYAKDETSSTYYPVGVKKYITYDVDSLVWNDTTCEETYRSARIRYTIADSFRDAQNRKSFRIETMLFDDTLGWQPRTVYYVTPTETGVEFMEGGNRFIKLSYPVEAGRSWQGNALIPVNDADLAYLSGWNYRYQDVGVRLSQGNKHYDSTVTVLQVDEQAGDPDSAPEEAASRLYGKEIYARNVGMIYREYTRWNYDPATTQCKKGFRIVMRAVDNN